MWLSQGCHQIIWGKRKTGGCLSNLRWKLLSVTSSLHLRWRLGGRFGCPCYHQQSSGDTEKLSSLITWVQNSSVFLWWEMLRVNLLCWKWYTRIPPPPAKPHKSSLWSDASRWGGVWAGSVPKRVEGHGFGFLLPPRYLSGQPATQPSIRICHVGMRKESGTGDASWKADNSLINHIID